MHVLNHSGEMIYIGQIGIMILESCKKNSRYVRLKQPETSCLAEHCLMNGHDPLFDSTHSSVRQQGSRKG